MSVAGLVVLNGLAMNDGQRGVAGGGGALASTVSDPSRYEASGRARSGGMASVAAVAARAPRKRVRRIRTRSCIWCGRRIKRVPGTRGPLPRRCPPCAKRAEVRRRLRAYLRSCRHYAFRLRRRQLALAIERVIRRLDAEVGP